MAQFAVKIKTHAQANQLASLVSTYGLRTVDGHWQNFGWQDAAGNFQVGNTAVFWLFSTQLRNDQFTSAAFPATLAGVHESQYVTPNELAQALAKIR